MERDLSRQLLLLASYAAQFAMLMANDSPNLWKGTICNFMQIKFLQFRLGNSLTAAGIFPKMPFSLCGWLFHSSLQSALGIPRSTH